MVATFSHLPKSVNSVIHIPTGGISKNVVITMNLCTRITIF